MAVETKSNWLWFLRVFGLNLWSTVYKYVIFTIAIEALFNNWDDNPCQWIDVPILTKNCELFFGNDYLFLPAGVVMTLIVFAATVEWLNNFDFFNLLYKFMISKLLLCYEGAFFDELRELLYTSPAFKDGGLISCNPAYLQPSTLVLPQDTGFLHAVEDFAEENRSETEAEQRGVFRFGIGQLDINIKTNQTGPNVWHVESITIINEAETEVLLLEMSSQQVNLMINVLNKWATKTPRVGVIQSTSKLLGFTVLHAMQLSEILDHISKGKDVNMNDICLLGKRVFIGGQMGSSVKVRRKKLEEV